MSRRSYGSGIFLLVIGAAVAALIGYAAYRVYKNSQNGADSISDGSQGVIPGIETPPEEPVYTYHSSVDQFVDYIENLPLERNPIEKQSPIQYYMDAPPKNYPTTIAYSASACSSCQSEPVVQNDETVTWTDWAGRERSVVISRQVR